MGLRVLWAIEVLQGGGGSVLRTLSPLSGGQRVCTPGVGIKHGLSNSGMAQREVPGSCERGAAQGWWGRVRDVMRGLIPSSTEECRRGALGGRMESSAKAWAESPERSGIRG